MNTIKKFLFWLCMAGMVVSLVLAILTQFQVFETRILVIALIGGVILALPLPLRAMADPTGRGYFKMLVSRPVWLRAIYFCTGVGAGIALVVGFFTQGLVVAAVPYLFVSSLYAMDSMLYYSFEH